MDYRAANVMDMNLIPINHRDIVSQGDRCYLVSDGAWYQLGSDMRTWNAEPLIAPAGTYLHPGTYRRRAASRRVDNWCHSLSRPPVLVLDPSREVTVSDAVDSIADQSGLGNTMTQTSTARPTLATGGIAPAIVFNGSSQWLACDGILPFLNGQNARSLLVWMKLNAVSGSQCVLGYGGTAPLLGAYQAYNNTVNSFLTNGTTASFNTDAALVSTRDQLVMIAHGDGANNTSVWVDGVKYTLGDAFPDGSIVPTHAAIGVTLSGGVTPANFLGGSIYHLSLHQGLLTDADYEQAYSMLFGRRFVIGCIGNSLTLGTGSTGGKTYPAYLSSKLSGVRAAISNLGHGAYTTQQLIGLYASEAHPIWSPGAANIAVVWEIGNDILINSLTARQAVDNYWTLVGMAQSDGAAVVACTCAPRSDFSAAQLVTLTEANALVVAEYKRRGCVGIYRDDLESCFSNTSNTIFFADGVHRTNAGYSVVAGGICAAIQNAGLDP